MKLRKDGKPDGRVGKVMARVPKSSHPWVKSYASFEESRDRAKKSGFKSLKT
jgi:hypothetical protein